MSAVRQIHRGRVPLHEALAALVRLHVAQLQDDGIDEPLAQPFTLAATLADLFTLAGVPVPADVAQMMGEVA